MLPPHPELSFGELLFSLEFMAESSTRNHVFWKKTDWHLLPFHRLGRMELGNCHLFCSDTFSMLLAQRSLWSPQQPGTVPSMRWKEGPACLVWLTLLILCPYLTHCQWRPSRPTSQPSFAGSSLWLPLKPCLMGSVSWVSSQAQIQLVAV